MATIIRVDRKLEEMQDINLEALQVAVGGYIEVVYLSSGQIMYVNEEGLIMNLPYNPQASALCDKHIVGDAVLLTPEETKTASEGD